MKKIVLISLLCLFSCKGQNKEVENQEENVEPIKKIKTMKYFDVKRFEANQKNGEYLYIDSLGNQIREFLSGRKAIGYGHYIQFKNNPQIKELNHYYHNGILKEEGNVFYESFRIGIWRFYNEQGILTQEIDYDKPFEKYPLEKVLEYMKNREVDLSGMYTRIYREIDKKGTPMWYLTWDALQRTKEDCLTMINIEIDAKQGEIIKEYHHFFWEYDNPYDKVPEPIIIFDKTQ